MHHAIYIERRTVVVLKVKGCVCKYDADGARLAAWMWRRLDRGIARALLAASRRAKWNQRCAEGVLGHAG